MLVETLLQRGADPNIPDQNGETPLFVNDWGCDRQCELLLANGADISVVSSQGLTALDSAI